MVYLVLCMMMVFEKNSNVVLMIVKGFVIGMVMGVVMSVENM